MGFVDHLGRTLRAVGLFSFALGLVLACALLLVSGIEGSVTLDLDLGRSDAPWFLVGTPLLFLFLAALTSPVSYALLALWRRFRGEHTAD